MRFPLTAHLKVGTNGRAPRPAVSSLLLWLRSRVTHPTPPLRPRTLVASDVNTPEWVKTGSSVTERFEIHNMLQSISMFTCDVCVCVFNWGSEALAQKSRVVGVPNEIPVQNFQGVDTYDMDYQEIVTH